MSESSTENSRLNLRFLRFSELDTLTLYTLIRIRIDVFVVEQRCAYAELDGCDSLPSTVHVLGYQNHEPLAYARILGLSAQKDELITGESMRGNAEPVKIGRVLVLARQRSQGLARLLMRGTLDYINKRAPCSIQLSAQVAVVPFYQSLGFHSVSAIYTEDGIEHVDMLLESQ